MIFKFIGYDRLSLSFHLSLLSSIYYLNRVKDRTKKVQRSDWTFVCCWTSCKALQEQMIPEILVKVKKNTYSMEMSKSVWNLISLDFLCSQVFKNLNCMVLTYWSWIFICIPSVCDPCDDCVLPSITCIICAEYKTVMLAPGAVCNFLGFINKTREKCVW